MGLAKKYESHGYKVAEKAPRSAKKQKCVYLSPDDLDFIHEFIYRIRKEEGVQVSISGLIHAGLTAFQKFDTQDQIDMLIED